MTTPERAKTLPRRAVLGTMLAMTASAIALCGAATPQARPGDLVDLQVVDRETGQALRVWPHDRRAFVAGQPGARYSLRVTNHTDGRVLVVMSVDGVNVISGQTAGYDQTGYVFAPHETYDVSGWRKSDTEVAAFTFAPLPQSYAARTGRPGDVGVIGIAAFKERAAAPVADAAPSGEISEIVVTSERRASSSAPSAPAPPRAKAAPSEMVVRPERRTEKLGTGHGARERSEITTVAFERATTLPQLVRRIEYDTYDNLVASGVIRRSWEPAHRPRPFPSNSGYAPDPPAWP